jgi:tetratricopeptide (TPR) repeat protein
MNQNSSNNKSSKNPNSRSSNTIQANSVQWMIRLSSGKQLGPYSTEAMLKLIREKALDGTEHVRRYPDGDWMPVSSQGVFYDQLLESLNEITKEPKVKEDIKKVDKINAETVIGEIQPVVLGNKKTEKEHEVTYVLPETVRREEIMEAQRREQAERDKNKKTRPIAPPPPPPTIELTTTAKNKTSPIFIASILLLVGVVAYFIFEGEKNVDENHKPHLLAPRTKNTTQLSPSELQQRQEKAMQYLVLDTTEAYFSAQSLLVEAIESDTNNLFARQLLCFTYKELWPFVAQDSKDLETMNLITKTTRSIDPTATEGLICESIKLILNGKFVEARGNIDYTLNLPANSQNWMLYGLKAEMIAAEGDYKTASLYEDKMKQLWPVGMKPVVDQAYMQMQFGDYMSAEKNLQEANRRYAKHKRAQLLYGLTLFRGFQKLDDSARVLSAALNSTSQIHRMIESEGYYTLAIIFEMKKDFNKAKSFSDIAYQLNPGNKDIAALNQRLGGANKPTKIKDGHNEQLYLGDQYFRSGNYLAAQAEYKAAFELDPSNSMAALKAAKALWQLNLGNEAILWIQKSLKADSKMVAAYVLQADYLSARYDYEGASIVLSKAQKISPKSYEIYRGMGLIEFRKANYKDAILFLEKANKIYPNDVETLTLLAKTYSKQNNYSLAQKNAVKAVELDRSNAAAQISYAKMLSQFEGVEKGISYLNYLINQFSYSIELRQAMAEIYEENQNYLESCNIWEQIKEADAKNKKAFLGLGTCYQGQALFDKSLRSYLQAVVADPSDPEGKIKAGLLYLQTEKYDEAIKQFKGAFDINPRYPRVQYLIGRALLAKGDSYQALQSALEERKINPNLADSYILAAESYSSTQQYSKCATEYQQAIRLGASGSDVYVKMARCNRQSGNVDVAENILMVAAAKESGNPEIYREQGAIYEQKQDYRSAIAAYNKYLNLSPNAPDKKEVEARINKLGGSRF